MKMLNIFILLAFVSVAFGHPNIDGTQGLFRSITVENGSAGQFNSGAYFRWFGEKRDVTTIGELSGEANHSGWGLYFGLGYAITDNFSFNISSSYLGDGIDYVDIDHNITSTGLSDTKIGAKLGFGKGNVMYGLYPFISFPTGAEDGGIFRYFTSGATDMGLLGLLTIKVKKLTLDINLGYVDRNINDKRYGLKNNYSIYKGALSYDFGRVVPFIEVSGVDYCGKARIFTFNDDGLFGPNANYITPGIGLRLGHFNIDLAVDIRAFEDENERAFPTALTDSYYKTTGYGVAPAWAVVFGVSYCYDFVTEKPKLGEIAGTAADSETKDPVETDVAIYKEGTFLTSTESDIDGSFEFTELEPGSYELSVKAEDYKPYSVDLLVKAGETTPVNVTLVPVSKEGMLVLTVLDMESKEPVAAEVNIGTLAPEIVTEKLEKTLGVGSHTIKVVAEDKDYLPYERNITIEAGETLEIEIALGKKEYKLVLPKVYFETDKLEIKPEFYPVLEGAVKTINTILSRGSSITIEVQGHTDNVNTDAYNLKLSKERANAVKNYLVTKHGIESERLITKGYGESKPVASNDTEEGRAKNRRVEFLILK